MAEALFSQDQFNCLMCQDLLKDPVAIPCGHSYCMKCIIDHWSQEDEKGVYSCPQCRQTFTPRPATAKNTIIAEVLEQLKKTELQTSVLASCYTEDGDVECDVCTGGKHKAVKSCLVCLSSYCQDHLEQHENLFKGKRHNLMDATEQFQKMICQQHNKLLEIYCRTDHRCICLLCMVNEHKNHDTVSTAAERTEKQKQLGVAQGKFHQQIQQREKKLQEMKEAVETHKRSAQTAVEDTEKIFTEIICFIEKRHSEVTQMIRDREKTTLTLAEELMKQLEQEIVDLNKRNSELEQLLHTHDHISFLQTFPSLPVFPESPDVPSITDISYDDVEKSVSQLKQKLEDFCRVEIEKILVTAQKPKTGNAGVDSITQKFLDFHKQKRVYERAVRTEIENARFQARLRRMEVRMEKILRNDPAKRKTLEYLLKRKDAYCRDDRTTKENGTDVL